MVVNHPHRLSSSLVNLLVLSRSCDGCGGHGILVCGTCDGMPAAKSTQALWKFDA